MKDIIKLIKAYEGSIKRKQEKEIKIQKHTYKKLEFDMYIKPEHKEEVMNFLINNIDLKEFIPKHLRVLMKKLQEHAYFMVEIMKLH